MDERFLNEIRKIQNACFLDGQRDALRKVLRSFNIDVPPSTLIVPEEALKFIDEKIHRCLNLLSKCERELTDSEAVYDIGELPY